jgi:hypothetical protein
MPRITAQRGKKHTHTHTHHVMLNIFEKHKIFAGLAGKKSKDAQA